MHVSPSLFVVLDERIWLKGLQIRVRRGRFGGGRVAKPYTLHPTFGNCQRPPSVGGGRGREGEVFVCRV